jgi:hypothetical protein
MTGFGAIDGQQPSSDYILPDGILSERAIITEARSFMAEHHGYEQDVAPNEKGQRGFLEAVVDNGRLPDEVSRSIQHHGGGQDPVGFLATRLGYGGRRE